jgi:hypothetical protein
VLAFAFANIFKENSELLELIRILEGRLKRVDEERLRLEQELEKQSNLFQHKNSELVEQLTHHKQYGIWKFDCTHFHPALSRN